ncbi:Wzz/FepE/Etk N-terminal domain-containing protein [Pseudomonas aeruginosa]|uniref:Wzz/FepE/Etk N-terminal domain-containing protein n=1 Tax=Pseudomonas aeruginosa TaxID=287 RepID=UPI0021B13638|nr:Wzz/FepE/Etk N-terminal domain-containing protein [Pseudomonas aeruginosa]
MTADGEVDLVKLVKELWVNKVLILLTTLLALIGSFTYAYLSKPVYEYRVACLLLLGLSKVSMLVEGRMA